MPQGARLSRKRYFEILMPGLVPGILFMPRHSCPATPPQ
jgi:hypothetical protein